VIIYLHAPLCLYGRHVEKFIVKYSFYCVSEMLSVDNVWEVYSVHSEEAVALSSMQCT